MENTEKITSITGEYSQVENGVPLLQGEMRQEALKILKDANKPVWLGPITDAVHWALGFNINPQEVANVISAREKYNAAIKDAANDGKFKEAA